MSILKELIIHITNIEDFSPFLHLSSLRKIVIGVDTLTSGDYKYFTGLNRLKELTIWHLTNGKRHGKRSATLSEFDRYVFENIVEKVIAGGYDEDGNKDPVQLTFVYKTG